MASRKEILEAFFECMCRSHEPEYCSKCYQKGPGFGFVCRNNVCIEVMKMVEQKEPAEPQMVMAEISTTERRPKMRSYCGACGGLMFEIEGSEPVERMREEYRFCHHCGVEVNYKWT
ncbi:MAG: hypothetical protein J6Y48_15625 [Clostridia bacterium]|nr:hypothetical protein [Clostridia bacterium]